MKFNVVGKTLKDSLGLVGKVVSSKNPLSILENFLLKVEGNTLTITGSDQENVIVASMEITDVEGDGSVAVNAKRMLDIMKESPDQGLKFYINDTTRQVEIKYLNGHFSFMGLPGDEYPLPKARAEENKTVVMNAKPLRVALEQTLYAVSPETVRPVMSGVCFDFLNDKLVLVASDTHKLVKSETRDVQPGFEYRFVMPAKAGNLLRGLLEKIDGDVTLNFDKSGATIEAGNFSMQCVFIHGNYPDYNRVIPASNPYTIEIDRNAFMPALRRMALTVNAGTRLMRFNIQSDEVIMQAEDVDFATSGAERVACSYNGHPMSVGFNAEYMLEVIGNLKADTINISLSDPSRPGILTPQPQAEGNEVTVLLMTMQLIG